jgi:hypothetical protein
MGNIIFSESATGMGVWNLDITDPTSGSTLNFSNAAPAPQSMILPIGSHQLVVQGAAPAGMGGSLALTVSGPIGAATSTTHTFPSGTIPPHFINLFVTA